ncbi:MAG: 50S ribosomal protein L5 [Holosporales bacterium]
MARLKEHYETVLRPQLMEEFGYKNLLEVPRLVKIVVNMGVGKAVQDSRILTSAKEDLAAITGQAPVITKASKSIAAFKLREGMGIGTKVTLRKERMYEFFDRLVVMAMPRIRNYQGASRRSFDGRGNYALGIPEHIVFYEVNYNKVEHSMGLDVVFVTTARTDREAEALLRGFGIPFKKK